MAYRTFVDSAGVNWQVWEVRPTTVERRVGQRRRIAGSYAGAERRMGADRRVQSETRVSLGPELSGGWLAFHSSEEKRRYAPIPDDWVRMSATELTAVCRDARTVTGQGAAERRSPAEHVAGDDDESGLRQLSA